MRHKPIPESDAIATPFGEYEPFVDTYAKFMCQFGCNFALAASYGLRRNEKSPLIAGFNGQI
jgi:hypothetical protein